MALVTCKDCDNQFSTDARRCPHCGAKKPINSLKFVLVTFAILGLAALMPGYAGKDSNSVLQRGQAVLKSGAYVCITEDKLNELRTALSEKENQAKDWALAHGCWVNFMEEPITVKSADGMNENVNFYMYRPDGERNDLWAMQMMVKQ